MTQFAPPSSDDLARFRPGLVTACGTVLDGSSQMDEAPSLGAEGHGWRELVKAIRTFTQSDDPSEFLPNGEASELLRRALGHRAPDDMSVADADVWLATYAAFIDLIAPLSGEETRDSI